MSNKTTDNEMFLKLAILAQWLIDYVSDKEEYDVKIDLLDNNVQIFKNDLLATTYCWNEEFRKLVFYTKELTIYGCVSKTNESYSCYAITGRVLVEDEIVEIDKVAFMEKWNEFIKEIKKGK